MQTSWETLEAIPDLSAYPHIWRRRFGPAYEPFKILCLTPLPSIGLTWRCSHACGCTHVIIPRHDGTAAVAACRCHPPKCPDIPLTIDDVTPLRVDLPRLGRAIARALHLQPKYSDFGLHQTIEIGTRQPEATPVILTIQTHQLVFRQVTAELALKLSKPFLLLAPTPHFMAAPCRELLSHARADFLDLASTLALNEDASFSQLKPLPNMIPHTLFSSPEPVTPKPRYSIRKDCGVWRIVFEGVEFYIKHERGMFYIAYLLTHPNEPIHALDLMAKIPEIYRHQLGLPTITDPTTGKTLTLQSHARLQERSLALDDREALRRLYKEQKKLEATLDDDSESEPVKAEALRELEAISAFQRRQSSQSQDPARRAAKTVRKALKRLRSNLLQQHPSDPLSKTTLARFAAHLQQDPSHPLGKARASKLPGLHPSAADTLEQMTLHLATVVLSLHCCPRMQPFP